MSNPKTALRVAMAAIAVPGVVAGVAAPAASAAELTPGVTAAEGNLSGAQQSPLGDAQHRATSPLTTSSVNDKSVNGKSVNGKSVNGKSVNGSSMTKAVPSDLTGDHALDTHDALNDKSVSM